MSSVKTSSNIKPSWQGTTPMSSESFTYKGKHFQLIEQDVEVSHARTEVTIMNKYRHTTNYGKSAELEIKMTGKSMLEADVALYNKIQLLEKAK